MIKSVRIIVPLILFCILLAACNPKPKPAGEEALIGEWYTIKGDVEAYSFLKDENSYIFSGTQGMRPVVYGTWKIANEKFVIIMDNGTTTEYSYNLNNDTLILNDGDEIYTRTEPLEVKHPEVRILKNISSDFGNLKFSSPLADDVDWGYYIDSISTFREFKLKGFSISAGTTLAAASLSDISNYIKDSGFESDTLFVTEICNGYWDADQLVIFCASQDPAAENDSIIIKISSAIVTK